MKNINRGFLVAWLPLVVLFSACAVEPSAEPFVFNGEKQKIPVEQLTFELKTTVADETTRFQPTNVGIFDIDQNGFPDLLLGRDQIGKQKPEQVRILRNRSWVTPKNDSVNFHDAGFLSGWNSTAFVPDG
jgi:hypothetical protein